MESPTVNTQPSIEASEPRFNALTHGILRESITPYEKLNFEAIYNELEAELQPSGIMEKILLERIVISYIKLARISKAEAELMLTNLNPDTWKYNDMDLFPHRTLVKEGYRRTVTEETIKQLDMYSRYETSAENRMYKAMSALMALKNQTLKLP